MTVLNIDDNAYIPVNKIVRAAIDKENDSKVLIWLVGGFVQIINAKTPKAARDALNLILFKMQEI